MNGCMGLKVRKEYWEAVMKKDNNQFHPESRSKGFSSEPSPEGTLEISSTGYGLESVSKEESSHLKNSPSSGGV